LVENIEPGGEDIFASIQVPPVYARLVALDNSQGDRSFILIEDVITMFIDRLFSGRQIKLPVSIASPETATWPSMRRGRGSPAGNREILRQRRWGQAVRLEVMQALATSS
jgi:polyphosphate kinase